MNPSLASAWTNSLIGVRHRGRRADERLPAGDLDDQLADRQVLRLGLGPPLRRDGQRVPVHPHAGPAAGDGVLARLGVDVGQRAVRIVAGQVPVPQLLQELDRGLPADLLEAHLPGPVPRASASVSPSTNVAAGRISSWSGVAPVAGQAALDVGVERLAVLQRAVPAEDRVRAGRGELAALVGVAGLEDDRSPLRAARHVELPADVEMGVRGARTARLGSARNTPDSLSAMISSPCQESNSSQVVCRNVRARSYRASCGRKPPRRKFSPVNASQEVTTFHAARPPDRWSRLANCRATS